MLPRGRARRRRRLLLDKLASSIRRAGRQPSSPSHRRSSFTPRPLKPFCDFTKRRVSSVTKRAGSDDVSGLFLALQPVPHAVAQHTRVVRQPGFLSPREAAKLRDEFDALRLQPYTNNPADFDEHGSAVHVTRYVHKDGLFVRFFPELRSRILRLAAEVDRMERWGVINVPSVEQRPPQSLGASGDHRHGAISSTMRESPAESSAHVNDPAALAVAKINPGVAVRCAEYHDMYPGGGLPDLDHYDVGSLVTVDVLLQRQKAGAQFQTVEEGGRLQVHNFELGDALVFLSHKYHRVAPPLLRGRRRVLVVELWHGEERTCDHRCDTNWGICPFTGCDHDTEEVSEQSP